MTTTIGTGTLQLKIGGMSCSFCANSVSTALLREKGGDGSPCVARP